MAQKIKIKLAREFRKEPTLSEKIMWHVLRNRNFLGLKFRRQHLIQGYLLDFYCHELRLAIEIDGGIHMKPEQAKYDMERQEIIEKERIKFIRVKSIDVENNLNNFLKELNTKISSLLP